MRLEASGGNATDVGARPRAAAIASSSNVSNVVLKQGATTHVEDDDSVVVALDRVFLSQPVHHSAEMAVEAHSYPAPLAMVRAGVAARYQRRFIHGPPRAPTSLRAPPSAPSV